MKIIGIFITIILGSLAGSGAISKYWFPVEIRKFLVTPKYKTGQCIRSSKRWGVNPKIIIGYKETKRKNGYLVKDLDRHEHYEFLSKLEVEKFAEVIKCRTF